METPTPPGDESWPARERDWSRRLRRIRLGAEPVEDQVARYRRVTLALTIVPGCLALGFVVLFGAFGRVGIGALLALALFAPVVSIAWIDQWILERRAAAYLKDRRAHEKPS